MKPVLAALAAAALMSFMIPGAASARSEAGPVRAEPPAEWAQACSVRRVRTVRPNGRVVVRVVRDCRPRRVERCRVERQQVVRPNGRVVNRTVRTCR
ncbi:hypothetical protein [Salinarimonas soli]|uniref:Uncharacterized protein n=1 Tax=Salinarimonas soli TaxID=1638099 RepID=A0A5B2VHG2_9HYPH|nr:hypothetical protein [Salinarimonas soli]KAA2237976.1 hypothetical protein F0L46_06805 [Salinarimonas soli]